MPFSKTPTIDTYQVVPVPFTGENITNFQGESPVYVNCLPLIYDQLGGKTVRIVSRPIAYQQPSATATNNLLGVGRTTDSDRGIIYYNSLFQRWQVPNTTITTTLRETPRSTSVVCFESAYDFTTNREILVSYGPDRCVRTFTETTGKSFTNPADSGTTLTSLGYTLDGAIMQNQLKILDNIAFVALNNRIYNSNPGAYTTFVPANNFIFAEAQPDPIMSLNVHNNHLVAFSTNTVEFFANTGNQVGSPLSRQEAYQIDMGVWGNAQMKIGDNLYFIGQQDNQYAGIYEITNFRPTKVSTSYIDNIATQGLVGVGQAAQIPCFTINLYGTLCPVFVLSKTVVYHPPSKQWFEMPLNINGTTFNPIYSVPSANTSGITSQFNILYGNNQVPIIIPNYPLSVNKSSTVENFTASITVPALDYGNNYMKHFYKVDLIGSIDDIGTGYTPRVQLNYNKRMDYTQGYVATQALAPRTDTPAASMDIPLRWRNLGRGTRQSYQFVFTDIGNMNLERFDVYYNLGAR
ncbi:packaged DNA stabilization protein [Microcystis sp. M42BS1]|uniref:packaged DNA stabilization protein n=1 Tax=Microcystis sp. M42BS1 TaxID=2771192 RepID=UPI00258C40E2|nr:packaged DNA stabilization protein [Microcystis sp. M42BS1]MCA2570710.1 hypothetical protein [Microcystis sp. M42BS1]